MSENNSENGNEEMVNDMTMVRQITDVQVKVVELIATMVNEGIQENWNEFVAGGFDVKAHVESAIKDLTKDDDRKLDVEGVLDIIGDYDITDTVQDVIGNYEWSDIINDHIDWSDAAEHVADNIDWDDRIRNNIDTCDIASDVADNLDIGDQIQSSIVDWVNCGCSTVDDVAVQLYDRAMQAKGVDEETVILSVETYDRIMEVVNFIRPAVEPVAPKTSTDVAEELVSRVDPTLAMQLVQTAIVARATADAEALVAATNGGADATSTE